MGPVVMNCTLVRHINLICAHAQSFGIICRTRCAAFELKGPFVFCTCTTQAYVFTFSLPLLLLTLL